MDDNTPRDLAGLVLAKITELGDVKAQEYFDVSYGTIQAWRTGKTSPSLAAAQKAWDDSLLCNTPEVWGNSGNAQIQLCVPMFNGIEPQTFFTLMRACKLYGMDKVTLLPKWRTLIIEARNDLAEKFLLSKSEWSIWPDADGVFPCGSASILRKLGMTALPEAKAARNAIERLMSHPKDKLVVGAVYKDRRGGNKVQCEPAFRSESENKRLMGLFDGTNKSDDLEKVGWTGFGLVRIHRSVFERMKEAAKNNGPLAEIAPPPGRESDPYGYFDTNRQARGEDVKFCRRCGQIGVDVWVDRGLVIGHLGQKCYA